MVVIGILPQPYSSTLCMLDFIPCFLSLKGGEENEDENDLDQSGIVSQGGKTSDSETSKWHRRRGSRSHIRDSIRSTRSDVFSRDGSTRSGPRQSSQHYHRQQSQQQEIQLEEITVHN